MRPVQNVPIVYTVKQEKHEVLTDGNGFAAYPDADASSAMVQFSNFKGIREAMVAHWNANPPGENESEISEDIICLALKEPMRSLSFTTGDDVKVVITQSIVRYRLTGMFFDSAKCFLLPSAMKSIRVLKQIYDQHKGAHLLVVGHTDDDAKSGAAYNDILSLERADAMAAFLKDNVDEWYKWYKNDVSWEKAWDTDEDRHMLSALPDALNSYYQQGGGSLTAAYKAFQTSKGLAQKGKADEATRKALIADYMGQDGTTLPSDVELVTHGCGQHFPDIEKPADKETDDEKEERQRKNRRVEIFLFDGIITPPPGGMLSGPNSTDYPAWREAETETIDISNEDALPDDLPDLSACFVVSSGRIPVANKPYKVYLNNGKQVSGTTDTEGKIFHACIEAGDYDAEVDGRITIVNTVPRGGAAVEVTID